MYESSDYNSSKSMNNKMETANNFYTNKNSDLEQNNNNLSPILGKNLNSNPISPKTMSNPDSRDDIKDFLLTVKQKIPGKDFKDFIVDIKMLTDKNNQCNKKEIIQHVNIIFQNHRDLYSRFEEILLIKKN